MRCWLGGRRFLLAGCRGSCMRRQVRRWRASAVSRLTNPSCQSKTNGRCSKLLPMRVFGIDCGTEFTGYGVVEMDCEARTPRLTHCVAGTIRLSKKEKTPQRLAQV